jgi:hypothetical protein
MKKKIIINRLSAENIASVIIFHAIELTEIFVRITANAIVGSVYVCRTPLVTI